MLTNNVFYLVVYRSGSKGMGQTARPGFQGASPHAVRRRIPPTKYQPPVVQDSYWALTETADALLAKLYKRSLVFGRVIPFVGWALLTKGIIDYLTEPDAQLPGEAPKIPVAENAEAVFQPEGSGWVNFPYPGVKPTWASANTRRGLLWVESHFDFRGSNISSGIGHEDEAAWNNDPPAVLSFNGNKTASWSTYIFDLTALDDSTAVARYREGWKWTGEDGAPTVEPDDMYTPERPAVIPDINILNRPKKWGKIDPRAESFSDIDTIREPLPSLRQMVDANLPLRWRDTRTRYGKLSFIPVVDPARDIALLDVETLGADPLARRVVVEEEQPIIDPDHIADLLPVGEFVAPPRDLEIGESWQTVIHPWAKTPPSRRTKHRFQRPRVREKVRKLAIRVGLRVLKGLISNVTEFGDFIAIYHASLPKHLQAKRFKSPPGYRDRNGIRRYTVAPAWKRRAQAVWANWDAVDVNLLIQGVIYNEFEDAYYGYIGQKLGKAGGRLGSPLGLGAGPADEFFTPSFDFRRKIEDFEWGIERVFTSW